MNILSSRLRFIGALVAILLLHTIARAQTITYDAEVVKYYQEGIANFDRGNYDVANVSFRKALATNKVLPTNLSYYFAETLYQIRQYQNSINFVDKYLELAGQGGDFYEEAIYLKGLIEQEFVAIRECHRCNSFGYRLVPCQRCASTGIEQGACFECRGKGQTLCPKCTGKGVYITLDKFNQQLFETCSRCAGDGAIVCSVCQGARVITTSCTRCLGSEFQSTQILCNHQDEQPEILDYTN